MIRLAIFSILVALSLPYWPELISTYTTIFIFCVTIVLSLFKHTGLSISLLLALLWVNHFAVDYAHHVEEISKSEGYITIKGKINTLISEKKSSQIFLMTTSPVSLQAQLCAEQKPLRFHLRAFWSQAPDLAQGQVWQLKVRLKPVVSKENSVGYDVERYYLSQNIHGNAYVVEGTLLQDKPSFRQDFYNYINQQLSSIVDLKNRYLILALSFAVRDFLTTEIKNALKDAGLLHLLAISGLHISLAFVLGWWLGARLSIVSSRSDRYYVYIGILSLSFAFIYAWLAEFSLSAQRALIMGSMALLCRQRGIPLSSYQPWLISFFCVFNVASFSCFFSRILFVIWCGGTFVFYGAFFWFTRAYRQG